MTRAGRLYDEDGIDGPFEANMRAALPVATAPPAEPGADLRLRLPDGTTRPLSHEERLAYITERAMRAMFAAEVEGDEAMAAKLGTLWRRLDRELIEFVGREGYEAAVAFADEHFAQVVGL